jgi:hypothetical protein
MKKINSRNYSELSIQVKTQVKFDHTAFSTEFSPVSLMNASIHSSIKPSGISFFKNFHLLSFLQYAILKFPIFIFSFGAILKLLEKVQ